MSEEDYRPHNPDRWTNVHAVNYGLYDETPATPYRGEEGLDISQGAIRATLWRDMTNPKDGPWRDFALCKGEDDLMFDHRRQAEAKALCAECPVRGPCYEYAMVDTHVNQSGALCGVWGGVNFGVKKLEVSDG